MFLPRTGMVPVIHANCVTDATIAGRLLQIPRRIFVEQYLYPSTPLHGRVAHEIGRQIVVGKFVEGSLLPRESELADKFDVSRQAVREALKVLAAKGLVASRRRTGTQVLPREAWNLLDPDVIAWHPADRLPAQLFIDLVELRRVVEPAAAGLAATRGDAAMAEVISAAVTDMVRFKDDPVAFDDADMRFHLAVLDASGNMLFQRLGLVIRPLLLASFHRVNDDLDTQDILNLHAAVAEAIGRGNAAGAQAAMVRVVEHNPC